ncbi:tripartite tricarboxylate transporter substrate binding protein [Marasmitruncus massiliensis]|uniref:tripartite tricarboxylate transporter substrate binding protein n=1 Tax=Marasmitruncus massiliensis TaxID=1944642 RepID=UPI000C7CB938|nr:tripartite tricarboxylate transporter substrate binding protein [Marasmitruncus massiliensis]
MKKLIATFLSTLLLATVAGCGSAGQPSSPPSPEATSSASTEQLEPSSESNAGGTGATDVNFPTRNVEIIVASAAGGGSDLLARALATELKFSQPVVVVNRTGAGGAIGTMDALTAKPDGHTILLGMVGPFETQPHLLDVQYNLDDFRYISALTYEPLFLVVKADAPWSSVQELKDAFASGSGNTLKFGSSSQGSVPHLAQEVLYKQLNISADHVPFDGANSAVVALLGGHIDALTAHLGEINNYVSSKELKILGVYSPERSELAPDIPTIKEQGYDIDISATKFIAVNSQVPDEIVEVIRSAVEEAKNSDSFKEFLKVNYSTPNDISEEDLKAQLKRESEMYRVVIEQLGLKNQ